MSSPRQGARYTSEKYPDAHYGVPVPEGGPGPNTLSAELEHITEKLRNVSDEDLYRIYHERWVNPDRQKPGWRTLPGDYIPHRSRRMESNKQIYHGSRHHTRAQHEAVEEYRRDQDALERERLIQYMIDPQTELLEDEAILSALFPDIENAKYPAYEMYKYKIKIEELHPYVYSIWDNVKAFYFQQDREKELLQLEQEPAGGIKYSDPIRAYQSEFEPLNQLVRSVAARTGDFMHHGNLAHETDKDIVDLYDQEDAIEAARGETNDENELPGPTTHFFLQYAQAMLKQAKEDQVQDDIDYWSEITRPFEYEPKEAPVDRPLFIEVPDIKLIRPGENKWVGDKYVTVPKFSSRVVFDYIAFPKNNPNQIIDSTYRIGKPITLSWGLDELPKCLALAFPMVQTGTRLEVTCPPRLLFGYDGWPKRGYPPNQEITFDIEVREIGPPFPLKSSIPFYHDNDTKDSIY